MEPADVYTARFDEVGIHGGRRVTLGEEERDREEDGAIPRVAWFHGEEYYLDVEDNDGVAIYVRRL